MAALDFPSSPTDGQTYTANGNTWTYESATASWLATNAGGASVTVDTTAPLSPSLGDLWWDSTNGVLRVYYNDGTSSQWVDASTSGAGSINAGPAFYAYAGTTTTSVANSTFTKIGLNTESFDTANCFDSTTNYRFTPNVAGYYQISAGITVPSAVSGIMQLSLYKNGAESVRLGQSQSTWWTLQGSALLYLNGSTDYVELYLFQLSGGTVAIGNLGSPMNFMSGFLARPA